MLRKFITFLWIIFIPVAALLVIPGCRLQPDIVDTNPSGSQVHLPDVQFPKQSDWMDYGTIFEAGTEEEWDQYIYGGFAFSTIKKDDTYYLYYQGSSDYRTKIDETVLWRAIGVATSQDGLNFSKHKNNPIITWSPNQNGEEGAVSSGVTLGRNEEIVLYYGANTEESAITVTADIRTAISDDGVIFKDLGIVFDHNNRSIWGNGDELFAVDAVYDHNQWIVYYIPNGTLQSGKLGVAYGDQFNKLVNSSAVVNGTNQIPVWGTMGHVKINQDLYALVLNNVRKKTIEVRLTTLKHPHQVSAPIETYRFENNIQANILLDAERNTWFLYYRDNDRYGVMLAPFGAPDSSPPTVPENIVSTSPNIQSVDLSWQPAEDPDTGIVQYRIYRNGVLVGKTKTIHFIDNGIAGKGDHQYQVSAVNFHGKEGRLSLPYKVTISN